MIDVIGKRKYMFIVSAVLILIGVMFLLIILKPNRWLKGQEDQAPVKLVWQAIIFYKFLGSRN